LLIVSLICLLAQFLYDYRALMISMQT